MQLLPDQKWGKVMEGKSVEVLFRAYGQERRMEKLVGSLKLRPEFKRSKTSLISVEGRLKNGVFCSLKVATSHRGVIPAMEKLLHFFRKHRSRLAKSGTSNQWIEVQIYLLPHMGSEYCGIPVKVLRAAANANCEIQVHCYGLILPEKSKIK